MPLMHSFRYNCQKIFNEISLFGSNGDFVVVRDTCVTPEAG